MDTLQAITWTGFFSTQLSYISQRNDSNGLDFYILDRETGKPLKNIAVEAFQKNYNYQNRRYESRKAGDYFSDEQGFISIPAIARELTLLTAILRFIRNRIC